MLERLINSQTRLSILALFFKKPEKGYYAREIVKNLKLDPANVHKELANLVAGQFLRTKAEDGKKYFFINQKSIFFAGLRELFANYRSKRTPELVCVEEMLNFYLV